MAYEIPQQLQYEERIIFGLTFKQLVYALSIGSPALLITFRTKMPFYAKATFLIILMAMACLFMFFNFSAYLLDLYSWLQFREASLMDLRMIKFIGIGKIQDGVVYVYKTKGNTARK